MNVFISGGSRGIGRDTVLKFAAEGWGVAFTYAGNAAAADETIKLAAAASPGVTVKAYQLDVKDPAAVEKTVEQAVADFDEITALVNNAAVVRNNAAVMMENDEWDEVLATNLSGPFYLIRTFLMHFISNRCGRIVNISSLAQDGCSGQANYAASKAGLIGLSRTIGKEYGGKGITCNVVTVGYVQTDMTKDNMADALHKFWMQHCPLKRVGSGGDIANAVFFLCSDGGSFINGEVLRVAGGLTYAP